MGLNADTFARPVLPFGTQIHVATAAPTMRES